MAVLRDSPHRGLHTFAEVFPEERRQAAAHQHSRWVAGRARLDRVVRATCGGGVYARDECNVMDEAGPNPIY